MTFDCEQCQWYLDYGNLDRAGEICGVCERDLNDLRAIENLKQNYNVYCDLDGVLADFVPHWIKYYQLDPSAYRKQRGSDAFMQQLNAAPREFWSEMPWTPEGRLLWQYVSLCNATILSAPAQFSTDSRKGKIDWINTHVKGAPYLFKQAPQKQQLSHSRAVLIDDYDKTIDQWRSRGGFGILHQGDAISTIKQLLDFGKQHHHDILQEQA